MDVAEIFERLDSSWFFSNILTAHPSFPCGNAKITQNHVQDYCKSKLSLTQTHDKNSCNLEQDEPRSPVYQKQKIQSPKSKFRTPTSPRSDVLMLERKSYEIEQRRGGMRSPDSGFGSRRKDCWTQKFEEVKGFMDLGFDFEEVVSIIPELQTTGRTYGFEKTGSPTLYCKIPPLSDGMAMKEHLRIWAHAVACNVR